ncbi:MAG: hypothetical protein K2P80_11915 [Beijerinckiaceae bacterium]|nr:hypothetical protein [Beijerinckiaceae bacterium]
MAHKANIRFPTEMTLKMEAIAFILRISIFAGRFLAIARTFFDSIRCTIVPLREQSVKYDEKGRPRTKSRWRRGFFHRLDRVASSVRPENARPTRFFDLSPSATCLAPRIGRLRLREA